MATLYGVLWILQYLMTSLLNESIRKVPLNQNLEVLTDTCRLINVLVAQRCLHNPPKYGASDPATPLSVAAFGYYNLFLFPLPGVHELYTAIRKEFRSLVGEDGAYFIGCWLSYYKQNEFLEWHSHLPPEAESWVGYFCVNAEPSKTSFKSANGLEQVDVTNQNNMLLFAKGDGSVHKTYPWTDQNSPRITIAFDIIPQDKMLINARNAQWGRDTDYKQRNWVNHWMPI